MMFEIGYISFVVSLFLLSGGLVLFVDVKIYKREDLKKETKIAKLLGWLNVSLGIVIFLVERGYYTWFT